MPVNKEDLVHSEEEPGPESEEPGPESEEVESNFLSCPQLPHAQLSKIILEKLEKMTPEEIKKTFIDSGILTEDGKLTEKYS